ncbi:MAG: efflux RND transporter periplasmic adaptor subunit [Alistipes sp.]|nr:efflux RND transporter periplasmic adaptor subunit [Alistipes sp.]
MKMNVIVKTLLVGGVCLASVACSSKKGAEAATETVAEVAKPKVTTAQVHIQDVDQQSVFTGNVEGYAVNNITPQQPRRITRLLVDVGDHVKKGQLVAELDNSALAQAKAQYENNKANFDRADELYKFGGESKANWEAMKTAYEVSKLTYENLLENTTLVSPISGVVTARNFENGDLFASMPILHIMQIDKLKVMANVSEQYFTSVKVGNKVTIEVDIYPGQQFEGEVTRINPAFDARTRTFSVEITIPNKSLELRPGMYARAIFNMGKRQSIMVPDKAIQKQAGSSERYVYVVENGVVDYRFVTDGRRVGDLIEVLDGVEAGDEVVLTSFTRLMNGKAVTVDNAPAVENNVVEE